MPVNKINVVIDADIARSSGTSEHPVSSSSRQILEVVKDNGHMIAMCPTLSAEWKKHRSLFAAKWLASMYARKQVKMMTHENSTKENLNKIDIEESVRNIALKDSHLIDIALHENKVVTSNDNRAREAFCSVSGKIPDIKTVAWFNAVSDQDFLSEYLRRQAIIPSHYFIG